MVGFFVFQMNSLNSSVTSVLTSLANAPQLQSVPADISDLKKEFGQFGSRLTDVETQVNSASDKLKNMHKEIKNLPDNSQNAALNDVSYLEEIRKHFCHLVIQSQKSI